ncbi:DNA-binding transcriptional regulator, HxlR family [Raineyella antarctica]|uniref:DNA-binding transcriptional regulator, HxlR family n=1 Tax=Raineyella antarctica TaxID=1577474 RepID=A0A1G6GKZ3_9ACTN|nr:helix-turn-helix domain-containing protein [Raineyella antarctica]SDB82657.1 DNA-binding transcriptional regulator, HxlR family [Raineyella antarctica]
MAQPFDVFDPTCPSRELVDHVIDRWGALVVVALLDSPHRFSETARAVGGISDRMLSRTLATLTADGLVTRSEQPGQRVEYSLTSPGRRVATAMEGLVGAIYEVMPDVMAARAQQAPTPVLS